MSWQKLSNQVLLKQKSINTLNEAYSEDIPELGYNRFELYPITSYEPPYLVFYFELFTNRLIAIRAHTSVSEQEIKRSQSDLFPWRNDDEERYLNDGIDEHGISDAFIKSRCEKQLSENTFQCGHYILTTDKDFLVSYKSSDGFNSNARDFLNIDGYRQEANTWYNGDDEKIKHEINLQAECLVHTDIDIIQSSAIKRTFAYKNGCVNYIAIAAFYKAYKVDFDDLLNSTHGEYDVIEDNRFITKIKAYGKIFTSIKDPNDENDDSTDNEEGCPQGFIYVMLNPSLPGLVKIGKTKRDPNERVKELSSATGVPTPFTLVYYKEFTDCDMAETIIHNYFEEKGARVNSNREFFSISTKEAIDTINLMYDTLEDEGNEDDDNEFDIFDYDEDM